MPNRELIEEWVEALESGKYSQGRGHLKDIYGQYCCLGVACEVAVNHTVIPPGSLVGGYVYSFGNDLDASAYGLPLPVVEFFGLLDEDGDGVENATLQDLLIQMNDSGSYSFGDIAKYLRERYLADA